MILDSLLTSTKSPFRIMLVLIAKSEVDLRRSIKKKVKFVDGHRAKAGNSNTKEDPSTSGGDGLVRDGVETRKRPLSTSPPHSGDTDGERVVIENPFREYPLDPNDSLDSIQAETSIILERYPAKKLGTAEEAQRTHNMSAELSFVDPRSMLPLSLQIDGTAAKLDTTADTDTDIEYELHLDTGDSRESKIPEKLDVIVDDFKVNTEKTRCNCR